MTDRHAARWIFALLLALYLVTGGGHGYSVDGAFGYEMAKTALLDPQHEYYHRFKTAFARWGALMPLLGQPLVLAGNALSYAAPERDDLTVHGHTFRVEEWPPVHPGSSPTAAPLPDDLTAPVQSVTLISYLANSARVAQGTVTGEVRLRTAAGEITLPVRAGVDTSEWAFDRPDIAGTVAHARAEVAGHWIGQPRGNLYFTRIALTQPTLVTGWTLAGPPAGSVQGVSMDMTWQVRAVAFVDTSGTWHDVYTGERFWSERQTRDFFTRLVYATLNAFTTAGSAVLVFLLARQLAYRQAVAAVAALGFGVATMAWPYAKLDFSEPASNLFVLLALWCVYAAWLAPGDPDGGPRHGSSGREVALGAVASGSLLLAVVGKYTAALSAALVVGEWLLLSRPWRRDRWRRAAAFGGALVLPAVLAGLAAGAVAYRFTGEKPIVLASGTGRLQEDWLALPFWIGLRGLVFSPGKSLFLYSPWLVLGLPGAYWLLRRHGQAVLIYVVLPALTLGLYSMKLVWHGGSWGPRYLLPIVPFLCLCAAPSIERLLVRKGGRAALAGLFVLSTLVQLVAIGKDPEQYPSMVREFVVPRLPEFGSRLGGYDYWTARGGPGLDRALQDPTAGAAGTRSLGYLWGLPTASAQFSVRDARELDVSIYVVDWDRQQRRERITLQDASGSRTLDLDGDFGEGVWATWRAQAGPASPLRLALEQTGGDTAVVSAVAFGPPRTPRQEAAVLDRRTRGTWRGVYGAEGYVLFGFRSFNIDLASLPTYLTGYNLAHVGDKPEPRIHVEIAEQDLRDTALLYAAPFSPLLGNLWLLGADGLHLMLPSRPDLVAGVLARPPWRWFGVDAPTPPHPEYGLGLDFWPTLIYTGYASHRGLVAIAFGALLALEALLVLAAGMLLRGLTPLRTGSRATWLTLLTVALACFDWLQLQP